MENKLHKLGIIGYGNMASYHHNRIQKPESLVYTAAYDISPARLAKATENGLRAFSDLEAFFQEGDFEAVLVATPNAFHYELALAALEHGKHVICEKPATLTAGEFSHLMAVARQRGLLLTTHQNRRMDKDYLMIRQILRDGTLGQVFRIESRVEGSRGVADTWRRKIEFGGGMLYDWGAHLIDQLLQLVPGKVTSVFARFQHLIPSDADDNVRLELEFENGVCALMEIGTCHFLMHPLWYVLGRQGSAQIDYWDLQGKLVQLRDTDVRFEDEIRPNIAGPSITMAPRAEDTLQTLPLPQPEPDKGFFYRNFLAALEGRENLTVAPEQTLRVMRIIDLAFASGKENQVLFCDI